MVKIGVVGTLGGWSSEKLADAVYSETDFRLLVEMDRVRLDFPSGRAFFDGFDLTTLDALIIKKIGSKYSAHLNDRLEILNYLHQRGLPVFSAPRNILRVLDRLSCTVAMQAAGIPMPETTITEDPREAEKTVKRFGEAVFKPLYTSKARGMMVIRDDEELSGKIALYQQDNPLMYIQKKIPLNGCDLGLAFLGGSYLTTYARCSDGSSWNTTTYFGGHYEAHDPKQETIDVAHKAQALFNLDFTSVDVVETPSGPLVFEVSAFGGFRGILETRDLDVAHQYVHYVLHHLKKND